MVALQEGITSRESRLTAALAAHVALRIQAERLIAFYIEPNADRLAVIKELINLFDGPQPREAERLTAVALGA